MKGLQYLLIFFMLIFFNGPALAQKKPVKKTPQKTKSLEKTTEKKKPVDPVADEKKVRELVTFLEYIMNSLGNSQTNSRDKEVLVTQSYSKIFRDSKVQVEDDLDDERRVVTNKNIVAYLKDVDFFFKDARFELLIEDVKTSTLQGGDLFYKVSVRRTLKGTTSDGKTINNVMPRFIEVNYNPHDQDLKIVSIYTNPINEKDALISWWNGLSFEWQSIFKRALKVDSQDSLDYNQIKNLTSIQNLNLSGNQYILDLQPLSQLTRLQKLDLSGTSAANISPIRNLTELIDLNLSGTNVQDLTPLRYALKMERLNISHTRVTDIAVVDRMQALKSLEMKNTHVSDFTVVASLTNLEKANLGTTKIADLSPFENLAQLTELTISNSLVKDLNALHNLKNLRVINLDSTKINQVQLLSNLENLQIVHINFTQVSDLSPLTNLKQLERVYCDQSMVSKETANVLMTANPKVLIIFDSKDLKGWWDTLSSAWQNTLRKAVSISSSPSKEELARIPLLDSINVSGNNSITDLEALTKLPKLKSVRANKTGISDLSPLRSHQAIVYLDISETSVTDLSPINQLKMLRILRADNSKIQNAEQLEIASLEKFYADKTEMHDITAKEFLDKNPNCLLVYKTARLTQWWSNLPENWKGIFREQGGLKKDSRENLHELVEQESLDFKDVPINNLKALEEFIRLKKLHISGTSLTSITPLENLRSLHSLQVTNSPIQKIDSIYLFTQLEVLNVSNTPLEDIYPVWKLKNLKTLNCSGTQIKRLDGLEKLDKLEYLDCSNTNVNRLSSLDYLPLKTLKCYNTKINTRAIENFKSSHPDCNVIYYR